jgi:hypothetical protein
MLYVYTGARSPHWVNHLIVLQGDVLQKRFLAELEQERAPLLVMRQDYDLAREAGMTPDVMIDEIPLALWHARIFDELMARSEPFRMAGRWQLWARSDWAPTNDWGPEGLNLGDVRPGSSAFELAPGATLRLVVHGTTAARAQLNLQFSVDDGVSVEPRTRTIIWPNGACYLYVDVLTATRPTRIALQSIAADATSGLTLGRIDARQVVDPVRADAAVRAEAVSETMLGQTALSWGRHDQVPRVTVVPLLAATDPSRRVEAGGHARLDFVPLPRAERSLLCELTLSSAEAGAGTVVVRYGVGDLVGGTYRFDLDRSAGPATYVFRPGMQANWHLRPNSWIEVGSPERDIVVHSARFCAND